MDSEPVRIVFLTEREDETIQCRVQDYRFARGNAVNVFKINCQDPHSLITMLRVLVNNNICYGGEEMRIDLRFSGRQEMYMEGNAARL